MPSLSDTISELGEAIRHIVTEAVAIHRLQPREQTGFQWKIANFSYDDSGVVVGSASGDYVTLKSWSRAWEVVEPEIKAHGSFKKAFSALQLSYPALPAEKWLDSLAQAFVSHSLPGGGEGIKGEEIVDRFLNDLEGGPITYNARVLLQGVVLRSETVEVAPSVRIRRPQKEEFEVPVIAELADTMFPKYPSAIIDIESTGGRERSPLVLQGEVERCVALLRLFAVGSVRWMRYRMGNSSIVQDFPRAELTSGDKSSALEKYIISAEDEPKLRRYWQVMASKLPSKIFDFEGTVTHITLAYDRYSDAVLGNGIIERRIANAVMGLEALFLAEIQELSYRLGVRLAKLISLVSGRNALQIRSMLKHAYGVRNKFAHGGHLTANDKRKIEQRYGSPRALLVTLLDYLRISILAFILCEIDKDCFIKLLDDALLDENENLRLKEVLTPKIGLVTA